MKRFMLISKSADIRKSTDEQFKQIFDLHRPVSVLHVINMTIIINSICVTGLREIFRRSVSSF